MNPVKNADKAWVIVAGCFAVTLCSGMVMWSFGVFFNAIQDELGGSRGEVSSIYTILIAANAASTILTGRLSDKGHSIRVLQVSMVVGGGAIALCSTAHDLPQLGILLFAVGLATGCTVPLALSIVQRVFHARKRSGLALAMVSSGIGLGALVFAPFLGRLILVYGWRSAFLGAGAVFVALLAFGWASIIRGGASHLKDESTPQSADGNAALLSIRRLMLSRPYVSLAAITLVALTAHSVLTVHLVPFALDIGASQTVAAFALGLFGGLSVPGRISCGIISDALGWDKAVKISLLGTGASIMLLPLASQDWMLVGTVVLFGFWHGARAVGVIGLIGHIFRMRSVGQLIGTMLGATQLVSAVGPYLAGLLHDYTGSYAITFIGIGAGLMLVSLAVPRGRAVPDRP